jgi:hypothetical protein
MSSFIAGTCRALVYTFGPQIVVCHRCRKFVAMPKLDVPTTLARSSARTAAPEARSRTAPRRRPAMQRSLGPRRLSYRRRTGGRRYVSFHCRTRAVGAG